jgi:hypothetical protein
MGSDDFHGAGALVIRILLGVAMLCSCSIVCKLAFLVFDPCSDMGRFSDDNQNYLPKHVAIVCEAVDPRPCSEPLRLGASVLIVTVPFRCSDHLAGRGMTYDLVDEQGALTNVHPLVQESKVRLTFDEVKVRSLGTWTVTWRMKDSWGDVIFPESREFRVVRG